MKVLFIDGTKGFSPRRIGEKASGGIVTSLTHIPQTLAQWGMHVAVASLCEQSEQVNRVRYIPLDNEIAKERPDVVVFNRNLVSWPLVKLFENAKKVWWLHDIVDHRYMTDGSFEAMDTIVSLSRYCTDTYAHFYDIPTDKFVEIPNAVDPVMFQPGPYSEIDDNLFVTASAPIKGLKPLAFIWHNLKRMKPNARLEVYSSQKLHDMDESNETMVAFETLTRMGVAIKDPVPQDELASVLRRARLLIMPNHYPEICSNLLLQAQACGCLVVASDIGSAAEFIKHRETGLLTRYKPHDTFSWWKDCTELVIEGATDNGLRERVHNKAPDTVWHWTDRAYQWEELLYSLAKREQ